MRSVKIFQTRKNDIRFMDHSFIMDNHGFIDLELYEYECVYRNEFHLSDDNLYALEQIYELFSINYHHNFHGRAVNVSDIIELDGVLYFVDNIGFKEVGSAGETNISLFRKVIYAIKQSSHFEQYNYCLDSIVVSEEIKKLTNYKFNFVAALKWGTKIGGSIECYLEGEFDDSCNHKIHVATINAIDTSIESLRLMGEFVGLLTYYENEYVNSHLDRFQSDAA
ncbi:MAG: hypothetical protein IBX70_07625 [Clostridia bacterium]|nr:hypothetical protein [Clostridia bacterium]